MSTRHILIIGSSSAALAAAEAARATDPDCQITLLSEDSHYPYYRQRLCEVLENPANAAKLALHPETWYDERAFQLLLNCQVCAIQPEQKRVSCADGRSFSYDQLILATGSRSFVPPMAGAELDGVVTLWTMDEALKLEKRLDAVQNAVVIGGGLLGLEAAYALSHRGIHCVILERLPRLMQRQLDERAAELFTEQVELSGSEVTTHALIKEIYAGPSGAVGGVRLEDGSDFPADLVFISAGVRARVDALADSGIQVDRCIVVDEQMRTNIPDIYAAGDCAIQDGRWYGLWTIAKLQGSVAGANAAGGDRVCELPHPPYMVNTMGTRIASAGLIEESAPSDAALPPLHSERAESPDQRHYAKKIYAGEKLVGFVLLGDTKAFAELNKSLDR